MLLIRRLLWWLPAPLASSICYRLFARRSQRFARYFDDAPLRYAPNITMRLQCGDWAHIPIAFMGVYEPELTNFVIKRSHSARSRLLVDVGANFGYFSLLWAGLHSQNRAIAFEPATVAGRALAANVARNQLGERVTVVPKAAGHTPGKVSFDENPDQTGWSHIASHNGTGTAVEMVRLDDELASGEDEIDLLKIDAEGHDWDVLDGSRTLFARRRIRVAIFECDHAEFAGARGQAWREFAESKGYRMQAFGAKPPASGLMECLIERIDG